MNKMDKVLNKSKEEATVTSPSSPEDPVLIRNTNDEASSNDRSFLAYERDFENKSRQIAILSFVVDNLKLLFGNQNLRVITHEDASKMIFLLDEDKNKTRNILHQLCLQFMKIFDTRTTSSDTTRFKSKKLNYAQAELKDALRILHEEEILTLEPLFFVLTRCSDVLETYVNVTCGRGKIESWKNVLKNCLYERMIISRNGNNIKELSKTLSEKVAELDEKEIVTLLEAYIAIKLELKRTEECNECLLEQIKKMSNTITVKENVITNLNAKVTSLTLKQGETKRQSKECSNCDKLEDEIKNIVREFELKKQAQHTYTKNRMGELERYKSTIKHLKDDLYKERTKKCSDCDDMRRQLKDVVDKCDQEKKALNTSNDNLMREVRNYQLNVEQLNEDLEFEKKPKRCESCVKIDTQLMTVMNEMEQEKQALYAANEALKSEVEKLMSNSDRLNDELNFNAMFSCNMIIEHNEVMNDLTHQIVVLQNALCTNEEYKGQMDAEHRNAVHNFEMKIKQLIRKLSEHNGDLELQARALNYEHEKVVNDLKCQLAALQAQLEKLKVQG